MPAKTPGLLRHGPALQLTEHRHFETYFREHPARGSNQSRSQCPDSKAGAPATSRQINALAPGRTASRQMRVAEIVCWTCFSVASEYRLE
jgi:hypothetical protein